jgi:hypothetical protein
MTRQTLLLLLLNCVIGCGKSSRSDEEPEQKESFDERSASRTLEWLGRRIQQIDHEIKPGNELSKKDAESNRNRMLAELNGKAIQWDVSLGKVNADSTCMIRSLDWKVPDYLKENKDKQPEYYGLTLLRKGEKFETAHSFPANSGQVNWLKSLKSGDSVRITGTVEDAKYSERGGLEDSFGPNRSKRIYLYVANGIVGPK